MPTNKFLYRIQQKETSLCHFCNQEEETIEHLLYDCNVIFNFWLSLMENIKLYDDHFIISKNDVLLGFTSKGLFLNLLFIIAKNYIFRCKFKNIVPTIIGLKSRITWYKSLDFYVACKNGKINTHERFWAPFRTIFQ